MTDPTDPVDPVDPVDLATLVQPVEIPDDWWSQLIDRHPDCRLTVEQLALLDRVLGIIAAEPHRWDQTAWMITVDGEWPAHLDRYSRIEPGEFDTSTWRCTSAYCLAGHTVMATHGDRVRPVFNRSGSPSMGLDRFRHDSNRIVTFVQMFDLVDDTGSPTRHSLAFDDEAAELLGLNQVHHGRRMFSGDNDFGTLLRYRNEIATGHDALTGAWTRAYLGGTDCTSRCPACDRTRAKAPAIPG